MSLEQKVSELITATTALTEEVSTKLASITAGVEAKKAELEAWRGGVKAEQLSGQARYAKTIDLTGLSTEYCFPVWWSFPGGARGGGELVICRGFSENGGAADPFQQGTPAHVAGLLLQLEGNDTSWGGDARYMHIKRISQTYRETVRQLQYAMKCIAHPVSGTLPLYDGAASGNTVSCMVRSGCYLRGGLTYHVLSDWDCDLAYSRQLGEVEIAQSVQSNFEIKWMAKAYPLTDAFLGATYPDKLVAYQYQNDGLYAAKI